MLRQEPKVEQGFRLQMWPGPDGIQLTTIAKVMVRFIVT
jgi:hypothetical protein